MRPSRSALGCLFLSLAGLGVCAYLGFLHIALLRGELVGGAMCGGANSILNCHAVTAGPHGQVLGIPLWVWGVIGYLMTLNLASIGWLFPEWTENALTLLTSLGLLFVALDLVLLFLMVTQIRYVCLFCLMTYVVNLCLLVVGKRALARPWSWIIRQGPHALAAFAPSMQRPITWLFWVMTLLGISGTMALHAATTFVSLGSPGTLQKQIREFVARETRTRPDVSNDPVEGPPQAELEIVEFSDFFCPVCQRASKFNTIIRANHRHDTRFIFKHFPLDTSCNAAIQRMLHPGACTVAAASECAHQQGKFWPFHDLIFESGHDYNVAVLEQDASRLGLDVPRFQACLASGEGLEAVKRDIAEGQRLGVVSTPTYVVNGIKVSGILTPAMFEELVGALNEGNR